MKIQVIDDVGQVVGMADLAPFTFKSGSRGFRANGRVTLNGKGHQLGLNLVEIGTKPKAGK